jgi:hypothetical protein
MNLLKKNNILIGIKEEYIESTEREIIIKKYETEVLKEMLED